MAKIQEIDEAAWNQWVASQPESVRKTCQQLPPGRLYRLKTSGHRVTLYSYAEDGTVTVNVTGEYNALTFERQVFGIKPEDLEECNLPEPGESLGAMLTDLKDVEAFCAIVRETPNDLSPPTTGVGSGGAQTQSPRTPKIVNYVMSKLPEAWYRWCPGGECCCMGCCNRYVSREEFEAWKQRHKFCEHCHRWEHPHVA